ncbi:hypothetical protein KKG05_00855 [bacterium]|nr:hypothetical protein [bacterium]
MHRLVIIFTLLTSVAFAQMYGDPSPIRPDTTKQDTLQESTTQEAIIEPPPKDESLEWSKLWARRLMLRGILNTNIIGAWTEYQLTDWSPERGSQGPIKLYLTVVYLGPILFLGEDAEWVQASVRVLDKMDKRLQFDLILPASEGSALPVRALVKEQGKDLREISFALDTKHVDYDALDNPRYVEEKVIELSHGKYTCGHFTGSGDNGARVELFLSPDVSPYGVVVMGYGTQGLTLIHKGTDVTPLLDVPPPPSR